MTSPKCFSNVFQFIVLFLGTAYRNTQSLEQSGAAWKTKCSLSCNMSIYAYDLPRQKKKGRGFRVEGVAFVKAKVGTQCGIAKSLQVSLLKEMGPRGIFVEV